MKKSANTHKIYQSTNVGITQVFENARDQEYFRRIGYQFSQKPYFLKYRGERKFVLTIKFLPSIISVLAGLYFFYVLLFQATGIKNSAVLFGFSAIILVVIEIAKHKILPRVIGEALCRETSAFNILIALCVVTISYYSSTEGIKSYSVQERPQIAQLISLDSINHYYQNQLNNLDKRELVFRNSVSYQGKINVYNKTTAQKLQAFMREREHIKSEHLKIINSTQKSNQSATNRVQVATSHQTQNLYFLVFGCEALLLGFFIFLKYYDYRAFQESKAIQNEYQYLLTPSDLKDLTLILQKFPQARMSSDIETNPKENALANSQQFAAPSAQDTIHNPVEGFVRYDQNDPLKDLKVNLKVSNDDPLAHFMDDFDLKVKPSLDVKSARFLEAYQEVIPYVLSGDYSNKVICEGTYNIMNLVTGNMEQKGLSDSTLRTLKQCLRSAGVLQDIRLKNTK